MRLHPEKKRDTIEIRVEVNDLDLDLLEEGKNLTRKIDIGKEKITVTLFHQGIDVSL